MEKQIQITVTDTSVLPERIADYFNRFGIIITENNNGFLKFKTCNCLKKNKIMEKETTNENNVPEIDFNRFDVIFEQVEPTTITDTMTQREKIFKMNEDSGIKVQSVCFPSNHNFFVEKKESEILDWLQNTIHSEHSALSQINKKYTDYHNTSHKVPPFLETLKIHSSKFFKRHDLKLKHFKVHLLIYV
jgi:hypothetical protein